ncbi:Hypothetical protein A7982_11109 [Minicystis rosea]|nr:Hypothetical protein A7982_11109 [Minicystis rosea]
MPRRDALRAFVSERRGARVEGRVDEREMKDVRQNENGRG